MTWTRFEKRNAHDNRTLYSSLSCLSRPWRSAAALALAMFSVGRQILSLFVDPEALQTAWELLMVMSLGLLIMYPMYTLRQGIQALGNTIVPLIAAVVQLAARILVTLILPALIGRAGMYFTTVTAWATSIVLIGAVFPSWMRKCQDMTEVNAK